MVQAIKTYLFWGFLFIVLLFAALNRHSRTKPFHYSSQIMSDKAGYYVYLPALFLYEFKGNQFPAKTDSLTGNGFYLNPSNNKVQSKYPVGVAVLVSPFFLVAHTYAIITQTVADGFSMPYQNAIDFAAVFYLVLGLYFLNKFLLNYVSQRISTLTLCAVLLGSNLYYYAIFEGGYSHVFTFFLFSVWVYCLTIFDKTHSKKYWIFLCVIAAFVLLVRQINIVFLLASLGLLSTIKSIYVQRTYKDWLQGIAIGILVLAPQILYNLYLTQTPFTYSYTNEAFIYWLNPKWKEVLVGFKNGWLSTNPIFILSIIGMVVLFTYHKQKSIVVFLISLACCYLYASWWAYDLGCGYGHRGFVDIYPFLSLPIAYAAAFFLANPNKLIKSIFYAFVLAGILFNLKYIYTYDSCWPVDITKSDAQIFWHFLSSPPK